MASAWSVTKFAIDREFTYELERSEKDQNCKLQFPQPDYRLRHIPDFRTLFGIMIGPFSSSEIGKT